MLLCEVVYFRLYAMVFVFIAACATDFSEPWPGDLASQIAITSCLLNSGMPAQAVMKLLPRELISIPS